MRNVEGYSDPTAARAMKSERVKNNTQQDKSGQKNTRQSKIVYYSTPVYTAKQNIQYCVNRFSGTPNTK